MGTAPAAHCESNGLAARRGISSLQGALVDGFMGGQQLKRGKK